MNSIDKIDFQNLLSVHGQEEIFFKDKFLGDENIRLLCEKLRKDPKRKLILRGNYIGTVGAKAIADLLKEQESLLHLSLEWNQIRSTGAEYLAEALLVNRSLVYLDLRNNYINSDASVALAQAIMQNTNLKTLDLRWNQIEDHGILAFKGCILDRKPSLNLLFHGNLLSETAIVTLNEWLKKGKENEDKIDLPAPFPERKEDLSAPKHVTIDLLNKEIAQLRQQLLLFQSNNNDLQRQLDSSLMKITELEQQLSYEKHENLTANEVIKQLTLRLSLCNDEIVNLSSSFDKERNTTVNDMLRMLREKENEVRDLTLERDSLKDRVLKLSDDNEQLKIQDESLQQQLVTDRTVAQNELALAYQRINDFSIAVSRRVVGVCSFLSLSLSLSLSLPLSLYLYLSLFCRKQS
jgi:hypothetical protein